MSDKNKKIEMSLDPNIKKAKNGNMTVWSHDKNSFRFDFYLDDGCGGPLILVDGKPRIMLIPEKSPIQIFDLNIVSERLGEAYFIVPERLLGFVGEVKATVYIDYVDGKTHDLGSFYFSMKKSGIDGSMPELTFYVEEFEKALEKAEELNEQIKDRDLVTHPELKVLSDKKADKEVVSRLSSDVSIKADKATVDKQVSELEKEIANTARGMIGNYRSVAELNAAYPNGERDSL